MLLVASGLLYLNLKSRRVCFTWFDNFTLVDYARGWPLKMNNGVGGMERSLTFEIPYDVFETIDPIDGNPNYERHLRDFDGRWYVPTIVTNSFVLMALTFVAGLFHERFILPFYKRVRLPRWRHYAEEGFRN